MIPYLVFDIENNNTKKYARSAGNFLYDSVVAIGFKEFEQDAKGHWVFEGPGWNCGALNQYRILVGHNIKHDLLFHWKSPHLQEWLKTGGKIWDTQLVHYLLSGQQETYPALREIAVRDYNCPFREKKMEPFWDLGRQTSEISKEIVLEDVKNDVIDTETIFLKQYEEIHKRDMISLIEVENQALLATCQIEATGMKVNLEILNQNKKELEAQLLQKEQQLSELVKRNWK